MPVGRVGGHPTRSGFRERADPSNEGYADAGDSRTLRVMSTGLRGGAAALEAIERLSAAEISAQDLLENVGERVQRVVPYDAVFLAAADPETGLCMGAGLVHNLPAEVCQPFWDHEFLVPDYNKFAELASGPKPVVDLHEATGGRPQRSARWREFRTVLGFESEARAAFTTAGAAWGYAQFNRSGDVSRYSADEIAWLARIAPVVAHGLRRALTSQPASPGSGRGPGILVLDDEGRLESATAEAEAWMAEVGSSMKVSAGHRIDVPIEVFMHATAARARVAAGGPLRARMRTANGTWLLLHATTLRDGEGTRARTAIVIEPAKASDVAPLIVEAYQLTQREVDVTRMVARGLKTAEIAEKLFLSPHTVRDHIKAVFEKVGVSSRGELVAKMFAEHYHEPLDAAITDAH